MFIGYKECGNIQIEGPYKFDEVPFTKIKIKINIFEILTIEALVILCTKISLFFIQWRIKLSSQHFFNKESNKTIFISTSLSIFWRGWSLFMNYSFID